MATLGLLCFLGGALSNENGPHRRSNQTLAKVRSLYQNGYFQQYDDYDKFEAFLGKPEIYEIMLTGSGEYLTDSEGRQIEYVGFRSRDASLHLFLSDRNVHSALLTGHHVGANFEWLCLDEAQLAVFNDRSLHDARFSP